MALGLLNRFFYKKNEIILDKKTFTDDTSELDNEEETIDKITFIDNTSELDSDDLKRVNDFYHTLTLKNCGLFVNDCFNLIKKADDEYNILENTIGRYNRFYNSYPKSYSKLGETRYSIEEITGDLIRVYNYSYTLLSNLEYERIMNNLYDVKRKLIIRKEALKKFVEEEKEECKKISNLILMQDKVENLTKDIDSIIHDAIQIIKEKSPYNRKQKVIPIVSKKLDEKDNSIYINISKLLHHELDHLIRYNLPRELRFKLLDDIKKIMYCVEGKHYKEEYCYNKYGGKEITKKDIDYHFNYNSNDTISPDWGWLTYHISKEEMMVIYKLIADYYYKREVYRKRHFNDYKIHSRLMNKTIKTYECALPSEWDSEYLSQKTREITNSLGEYLRVFEENGLGIFRHEKFLSHNIVNKLYSEYYHLSFIYASIYGDKAHEKMIDESTKDCPYHISDSRSSHYHYYLMKELVEKVEAKYNVVFSIDYGNYAKNKDYWSSVYRHEFLPSSNEPDDYKKWAHYIYFIQNQPLAKDLLMLLHGKDDFLNFYFENEKKYNLNDYIKNQFNTTCEFDFNHINKPISLEELFYILKIIKWDNDFQLVCNDCYNFGLNGYEGETICNEDHTNFLMLIAQKKIDRKYNPRILVIPESVSLRYYNIKYISYDLSNTKAIYISNYDQFTELYSENNMIHNFEKIIINENLYNDIFSNKNLYNLLLNQNSELIDKIIVIPEIKHYSDISKYLDDELEKKNNRKRLVKSI